MQKEFVVHEPSAKLEFSHDCSQPATKGLKSGDVEGQEGTIKKEVGSCFVDNLRRPGTCKSLLPTWVSLPPLLLPPAASVPDALEGGDEGEVKVSMIGSGVLGPSLIRTLEP